MSNRREGQMEDIHPYAWKSAKFPDNKISYAQALRSLAGAATKHRACLEKPQENNGTRLAVKDESSWSRSGNANSRTDNKVSVLAATGRLCTCDIRSPCSTPARDTSAMDGFAVASKLTATASREAPVKFRVAGVLAAGGKLYKGATWEQQDQYSNLKEPLCFEIMTGACFPEYHYPQMDAAVKVEDVVFSEDWDPNEQAITRYILLSTPVQSRQHRRPAGSDISKGELIVAQGTRIEAKHVMALVSVGISHVQVLPESISWPLSDDTNPQNRPRIAVLSTGSELYNLFLPTAHTDKEKEYQQKIPDSNGPYITSALQTVSLSRKVDYLGPCPDDEQSLFEAFRDAIETQSNNVLVTSGGVSMGRFDLVRKVVESYFNAEIIFHGCLVRPGAPVMFSLINWNNGSLRRRSEGMTAVVSAPGNPLAAAMTVRFFLRPYLEMLETPDLLSVGDLRRLVLPETIPAPIKISNAKESLKKPTKVDAFLLGKQQASNGLHRQMNTIIELSGEQASYKVKPFVEADCWVVAPAGLDRVSSGDELQAYSLW